MFTLIAAQLTMGAVQRLPGLLRSFRKTLELRKLAREEERMPLHLDLYASPEQLKRILQQPDVSESFEAAARLKENFLLPRCETCGSLHVH